MIKNDDEQEYCICKSKDTNRFMIGCDQCNQWFHGECISITTTMAKTIKQYYCPSCIAANPQLTIVYKVIINYMYCYLNDFRIHHRQIHESHLIRPFLTLHLQM